MWTATKRVLQYLKDTGHKELHDSYQVTVKNTIHEPNPHFQVIPHIHGVLTTKTKRDHDVVTFSTITTHQFTGWRTILQHMKALSHDH